MIYMYSFWTIIEQTDKFVFRHKTFLLPNFLLCRLFLQANGLEKLARTILFNNHSNLFVIYIAILLYRLCRCLKHIYAKLAHTFFHALAIPCIVIGFLAVFDSHNLAEPPLPNFYSLHSWLGLVTMGLFVLQFVFGFFTYVLSSVPYRFLMQAIYINIFVLFFSAVSWSVCAVRMLHPVAVAPWCQFTLA